MKKELLAISAFTAAAGVVYYIDSAQTIPSLGQLQARTSQTTDGTDEQPTDPEGSDGEDAGATPSNGEEYVGDPDDSDSGGDTEQ